jgi:type I restriction enzyme, S subunit
LHTTFNKSLRVKVPASEWKGQRVEELVAKKRYSISMGPFGSRITKDNFVSSGVPVIRGVNLSQGRFYPEEFVFLTEDKADELISSNAYPDDLVFTHRGTLGQVGIIPRGLYPRYVASQSQMKVTFDESIVSPMFMFYYFSSIGKTELLKHVSGSGVPAIASPLTTLRNLRVRIPFLPIQQKIAAILSAYDDLIENNLRRIKILEEMAQTLYREWFVHFRFPGHQKVKMVNLPLGKIPEGWEIRQIDEVIETLGGGTPSTKEPSYWEGGNINWYSPSDLTASGSMFITGSSKKITQLGLDKSSAKLFPAYSLMMTSRATIGVISINTEKACTNQGFITCIPNDRLSVFHLYFWIKENREKIISVASGATFKEISRGEFREFPIVVPPLLIENTFVETVEPIRRLIENLIKRNYNLVVTRDLLLPKLISGELDVSELDITIPEANA